MSNLNWDSAISADGNSFEVLPAGRYRFEVLKLERATSQGKSTAGAPMARLEIKLLDPATGKIGMARETLVLHKNTEWKLCEFFRAIGHRKHGEAIKPRWNEVVGASGECTVGVETFTKQDGSSGESNKVSKFHDVPGSTTPAPF
jgi:hypothetical protein